MGKSAGLHWGWLTCAFSWKRADAQEGTGMCTPISAFCLVTASITSAHIPLATASPRAKTQGKREAKLSTLKKCVFLVHSSGKLSKGSEWVAKCEQIISYIRHCEFIKCLLSFV